MNCGRSEVKNRDLRDWISSFLLRQISFYLLLAQIKLLGFGTSSFYCFLTEPVIVFRLFAIHSRQD